MNASHRPLSPHLQIYRPQLTSVLSITHRGTGVALVVGSALLVYWLLALAAGPQPYEQARAVLGSWYGRTLMFGFSYALFFHLCNGIRHLFWDVGLGFDLDRAYASAKAVLVTSAVLTLAAWIGGYAARGVA